MQMLAHGKPYHRKAYPKEKTIGSNEENIANKSSKIIDFVAVLKYSLWLHPSLILIHVKK